MQSLSTWRTGSPSLLHLLVSEAAGTAAARRLAGTGETSWNLNEHWFQLYVVSRTGILETLKRNWTDLVRHDRLCRTILCKLMRFVARKIGIPSPEGSRSIESHFQ